MRMVGIAEPYRIECDFMQRGPDTVKAEIPAGCTAPGSRATWFIWGDSHAQALVPGLMSILPSGTALAQVTTSSCRPGIGSLDPQVPGGRCERTNRYALERIGALRPDIVILAQAPAQAGADWDALAGHLRELGAKRVVLAGPAPIWLPSLPEVVTSRYWGGDWTRVNHGLVGERINDDAQMRARYGSSSTFTYVSLIQALCDAAGCLAAVPGSNPRELFAFDSAHMTPLASRFVAGTLLRQVLIGQ
jgi:hypothetical protein